MATAKNLIGNSNFEQGTSGWGLDSQFTLYEGTANTGRYSIRQIATSGYSNFFSNAITVAANTDYIFSGYFNLPGATSEMNVIQINVGSAFGTTLASVNIDGTGGVYTRKTLTFNSGANTTIYIRVFDNGQSFTGYLDTLQLELGSTATSYQDAETIYPRPIRLRVDPFRSSVIRGYAVSGMEFSSTTLPGTEGTHFTKGVQNDYTYYANKGLNFVRVAFLWERAQPTVGGALDTTYMGYLVDICNFALNAGLKVMFEPHNFGGRGVSGVNRKIGSAQLSTSDFADFWTRFVQYWLDRPTQLACIWGWDIMNEPADMPVTTSSSNYLTTSSCTLMNQAAIDAIRALDTTRYIVAEVDNYASLTNYLTTYGSNPDPWLTDAQNKTYYSFHYYFDTDHSGTYSGASINHQGTGFRITDHGEILQRVVNWAIGKNLLIDGNPAVFIGEYGVPNETLSIGGNFQRTDDQYLVAMNDFLTVATMNNVAVCHWAGGQWYSSPTSLSPSNGYSRDRHQMRVVDKYLGTNT